MRELNVREINFVAAAAGGGVAKPTDPIVVTVPPGHGRIPGTVPDPMPTPLPDFSAS